jgi:exodeoxyribonuclease X
MSGVYFFDTETTSLNPDREVIEAAWIRAQDMVDLAGPCERIASPIVGADGRFWERYKPSRPITLGSIAVHHILPAELEGCPPPSRFVLPPDAVYIVGHNVDFDWEAIGKPANVKRIDTDCMARYVYPDLDSYSQSALLYHLLGAKPETRERLKNAHSALQDVENNVVLLEHILRDVPQPIETWSELYAYSEACRIPRVMPIGDKQGLKGMPLDEAYEADPGFIGWCLRQDWIDDYFRKGLEQTIERAEAKWRTPAAADGRPF